MKYTSVSSRETKKALHMCWCLTMEFNNLSNSQLKNKASLPFEGFTETGQNIYTTNAFLILYAEVPITL